MDKHTNELVEALKIWLPVIEGYVEASHLTEGFARKRNCLDDSLEYTKQAIAKAEGGKEEE